MDPRVRAAFLESEEGAAAKARLFGFRLWCVDMLQNLSFMIDVERAECAVRADYDREMAAVHDGVGVETVNKRVAGAVSGGMASTDAQVSEVDAAVCGESEAL